jgi:uncharacterized protein YqhQ
MKEEEIIVGGQAVIEGVMMRAPNAYAVAVRRPDGQIVSQQGPVPPLGKRYPFLKLPVFRGGAVLIHSMALGVQALNYSASVAFEAEGNPEQPAAKRGSAATAAMILPALAFNIVIFIFLPLLLTNFIFLIVNGRSFNALARQQNAGQSVVAPVSGHQINSQNSSPSGVAASSQLIEKVKFYLKPVRPSVLFNLVDGFIRMIFFLTFIALMSRLKDIKRVFQYHGAEHKVVYNWESGEPLTVENARRQPRQHPRCGTSFLMIVMLTSIVIFSIIKFDALVLNFAARVLLIPFVAGISYEFIRFSAKCLALKGEAAQTWRARLAAGLFAILTAPGLWLQNLTTHEPSDDQLEVAIYALKQSLGIDSEYSRGGLAAD